MTCRWVGLLLAVLVCSASAETLLGQWTFDEGAGQLAFDSSGGGNAGQLASGVSRRTGPYGSALSLNGTPQGVVNIFLPNDRQFRRDSFSMQVWCAPRSFAIDSKYQTRRLLGFHDYPSRYAYLDVSADGHVTWHVSFQPEGGKRATSTPATKDALPLNTWTHLVAVCDRENQRCRVYLNGKLAADQTLPGPFDGDFITKLPFTIGSGWQSFDGLVGEVEIYRDALTAEQALAAYDASKARYAQPVTEPKPVPRPGGKALKFYVLPQGNDGWSGTLAKPNAAGTDGPFQTLTRAGQALQPGDSLTIGEGIYHQVLRPGASGTADAPITIRAAEGATAMLSGATPFTGWKHDGNGVWSVAMPWSLGEMNQLFCNGEMLTEARWPNNAGTLLQPTRATIAAATLDTITDPTLPGDDDFWKGARLWCAGGSSWYCWTREITAYDAKTHTLTFTPAFKDTDRFYKPRPGNLYALMGTRQALDAPGEWWYDQENRRVLLIPPDGKDPNTLAIEAKQRGTVIDLNGLSQIKLYDLSFRAGGITTDSNSSHLLLQGLKGEYIGHTYRQGGGSGSVSINGNHIDVVSCEFSKASHTILRVAGSDNRVVNCYVHEGDYAGDWSGCVAVTGRRQLISRNTFAHAGRDLVSVGGLAESKIESNDLSYAGWLTHDLGMTYGHTTDFMNTEFRYNVVHDNAAEKTSMGIYFDHLSMNVIVHHNVIWNTKLDPVRFNNPSFFCLSYQNTAWHTGNTGTFDHSHRNDLYGTRFYNDLLTGKVTLPDNAPVAGNVVSADPGYVDPEHRDFRLKDDSEAIGAAIPLRGMNAGEHPDAGAIPHGTELWAAGHDFAHPPELPVWKPADVPYMNTIFNSCFEHGLEGWTKTGAGAATIQKGNGWGNGWGDEPPEPTGTCRGELELGPGLDGLEQVIEGLYPNTCYTFSGWLKAVDEGQQVELGASDFGGAPLTASSGETKWTRVTVDFKTGATNTSVKLQIRKTTPGEGHVRADNLGLPKAPAGSDWEHLPENKPRATTASAQTLPVPPPFKVRRVANAPQIDGKVAPNEWPTETMPLQQGPSREKLKQPATARLAHDGRALYLAVTVPVADPAKLRRGSAWRVDDGVEVCLVDAKGAAPTQCYLSHGYVGGAQMGVTDGGVTEAEATKFGQAVRFAASVGDKSWTGEWAIPLAAADTAYSPGLQLPFNLCAHRTETDEWVLWVGAQGPAWQLQNAGVIVLE